MPFYEYQCQGCGAQLEALQKITDAPLKKCPECGKSRLKKLVSAPVFRLKGGGWYETDFKSDGENKRNLVEAEKSGEDKSEGKAADGKPADTATGDKADAKPAAAADKPAGKPAEKAAARKPAASRSAPRKTPARKRAAAD